MIRRICLYGGAGCGKSVIASMLFAKLKIEGLKVEYVPEYVKGWAYQNRVPKSFQQVYIFGHQLEAEDSLMPYVDHIVTDSPILMNAMYSKYNGFCGWEQLQDLAMQFEEQYPSLNIFLDRKDIQYQQSGRYEDLNAAQKMDEYIQFNLSKLLKYVTFDTKDFDGLFDHIQGKLIPLFSHSGD